MTILDKIRKSPIDGITGIALDSFDLSNDRTAELWRYGPGRWIAVFQVDDKLIKYSQRGLTYNRALSVATRWIRHGVLPEGATNRTPIGL